MGRSKGSKTVGMTAIDSAVRTYELGALGSVAPLDYRLPLVRVSALARQIRGDDDGGADEKSYGLIIINALVAAKRQGLTWADVQAQVQAEADAVASVAADELLRLADDGGPHAAIEE